MENKVTYQLNCPWYDRRNGREYNHMVKFTESEWKKYREVLYFTSGMRCFDKEGNLIEDPFEQLPHSIVSYYDNDCGRFFYEMACEYNMDFSTSGTPNNFDEDVIGEVAIFNEKPYSDGTFTYPGMYEFAEFIKEPEKYPF